MSVMKIGAKIGHFSTKEYIEQIAPHVDFFEVYIIPGFDYEFLKCFGKETAIHAAHQKHNFNPADPKMRVNNQKILRTAIKAADFFEAEKIIIHPGYKDNEACSLGNIKQFLKENFDSRILVENLPTTCGESTFFCTEPSEIKEIMDYCKVGFCLDITHAAEHSYYYKKDPEKLLDMLYALQPKHLHLCDTKLNMINMPGTNKGSHLSLGEGDIKDINLPKYLDKDLGITLETPADYKKQIEEIDYLKSMF